VFYYILVAVPAENSAKYSNSKPAEKGSWLAGKNGGRTAANFGQKRQKTGKKILKE
jgi:hypothetical protein